MRKPAKDPIRENRIHDQAIVDAYGPEEKAMSWYYYLENNIRFPFHARCIVAKLVSPLTKGETVEVRRLTPEDACSTDMLGAHPMAGPEHRRPSFPTGAHRSRRLNRGSHRRLAILGIARLPLLN
jgi:hypothetical protein